MQRIFSGIQPTGIAHLGNYLGAIRNWVALQDGHDCIYCVVDLHAITENGRTRRELAQQTREMAAMLLACGIDPQKHILFAQSSVRAHAQLAWIFNCVARIGWLNRMTQFKDKAGKNRENASAGLYVYPNLMAADILAYHATGVPVGEDQRQHLELANDIAQKFNHDYGVDFFPQHRAADHGAGAAGDEPARRHEEDVEVRPVGSEPHQPERRCRHDRAEDPPREDRSRAAAVGAAGPGEAARGAQSGRYLRGAGRDRSCRRCCASMAAKGSARSRRRWRRCWWTGCARSLPRRAGCLDDPASVDAVLRDGAAAGRGDRRPDRGRGGAAGRFPAGVAEPLLSFPSLDRRSV